MKDILAKLMPERSTSAEELEEMRRIAWQSQGVIAVRPHEIRDDWLRQALINLAEARYGRRRSRGLIRQSDGEAPAIAPETDGGNADGDADGEGSR